MVAVVGIAGVGVRGVYRGTVCGWFAGGIFEFHWRSAKFAKCGYFYRGAVVYRLYSDADGRNIGAAICHEA